MITALIAIAMTGVSQDKPTGPGDAFIDPPRQIASITDVRAWLDSHRAFGFIRSKELAWYNKRLFVAWCDPFSGRQADVSWVFLQTTASGPWRWLDRTLHKDGEAIRKIRVSADRLKLEYVSVRDTVILRQDLALLIIR